MLPGECVRCGRSSDAPRAIWNSPDDGFNVTVRRQTESIITFHAGMTDVALPPACFSSTSKILLESTIFEVSGTPQNQFCPGRRARRRTA